MECCGSSGEEGYGADDEGKAHGFVGFVFFDAATVNFANVLRCVMFSVLIVDVQDISARKYFLCRKKGSIHSILIR